MVGKLINGIPGSRLLISSLPGLASRMHFESLSKPRDSTSLPGKLTHLSVFSIYMLQSEVAYSNEKHKLLSFNLKAYAY